MDPVLGPVLAPLNTSNRSTRQADMLDVRPKVGVLLMNSSGQCGYQLLPPMIDHKLADIINKHKIHNKSAVDHNHYNHNNRNESPDGREMNGNQRSIDGVIYEMMFGSVALNFCAQNSSKIHQLSDDLLMTSFVFQIDFSNGRIVHKKYGLAIIWNISESDGQLRQLILKETVIIDALINELRNELIESRLKSPKHIHKSVTKFIKSVNDYLSVCRLSSHISDDQFIDELTALINRYDMKSTHFFFSTLLTSILMFKYKSNKMKLILWSNDVNKISIISQLLIVINQFLKPNTQTISYSTPQMKSIKFCHNFNAMKRTSSVTPITKSIISERRSRDESLGYESLTESGSTTTSTICDYNGFASKSLDASTPLEQSLDNSVEHLDHELELAIDAHNESADTPSSSQLIQSRNYFREYRNLRFTSDQTISDTSDEDISSLNSCDNCFMNGDKDSYSYKNGFTDDEDCDTITDVEEICESPLLLGFGEISMPELIPDANTPANQISLSQSPTISDTYLSQIAIQGIINSKTIYSFDVLNNECLQRSAKDLKDNTIIVCDCDLWAINYIENSNSSAAVMSSTVGQLCETIVELNAIEMNTQFIMKFIDNKMNELILKSNLLKSLIENICVENLYEQKCIQLFNRDSKQSLLSLIANNYFNHFSTNHCLRLGFDVSDIPVIIALNRHSLLNNYNNMKQCERKETHFVETLL